MNGVSSGKSELSRLILQKILTSESTQYMSKESHDKISASFLSDNPDKDLILTYRFKGTSSSYYNNIAEMQIGWKSDQKEIQDLEGNIWSAYQISINTTIMSSCSNSQQQFLDRAECISQIRDLILDIQEMVPEPIRVMTLTSDQRIVRDKMRKNEQDCNMIREVITAHGNKIRRGVRLNGVRRFYKTLIENVSPGDYNVEVNDGSARKPRIKKYFVSIPKDGNYAILQRTW